MNRRTEPMVRLALVSIAAMVALLAVAWAAPFKGPPSAQAVDGVSLSITKSCSPEAAVGGLVRYVFTLTNTGGVALDQDSVIDDPVFGDISGDFPSHLSPGGGAQVTKFYTVQESDARPLVNTVTATYHAADGTPVLAEASCSVDVPHLTITKTLTVNTDSTFTFTITNDGNVLLRRYRVIDNKLGEITSHFPLELAVGQTEVVEITVPGQQICDNEVTAVYQSVPRATTVTAKAKCTPPPPKGSVHLTKVFEVGQFTKPTKVCFRLDEQVDGFVPSPDPPEGADQCKVPDASGEAMFWWTNLDLPDSYRVVETLVECERQVDGIILESPCTAYPPGPIPPEVVISEFELTEADPTENITVENPLVPGLKRITKQNADGSLWTGPDVTFHICAGSVSTCDPSSPTFEGSVVIPSDGNPVVLPEPEKTYTVCEVPPPNFTVEPSVCQAKAVLAGMTTDFVFTDVPTGGEACTPGFWRNLPMRLPEWTEAGYHPTMLFADVFGFDNAGTLGDAINARGGGLNKLLRFSVASLLSAGHPDINFALTEAEVIAMAYEAYVARDYNVFDGFFDDEVCPL